MLEGIRNNPAQFPGAGRIQNGSTDIELALTEGRIKTFKVELTAKDDRKVSFQGVTVDDANINATAVDQYFRTQEAPVLICSKIGKRWRVSIGPNNRLDPSIDFPKEIVNRLGPKWASNSRHSATMIDDGEITSESLIKAFTAYEAAASVKETGKKDTGIQSWLEKQGLDSIAGYSKNALIKEIEAQFRQGKPLTVLIVNISLKPINDSYDKDAGHDALKQIETKISDWAKEQGIEVKTYRQGATFVVKVPEGIDIKNSIKSLQTEVSRVTVSNSSYKTNANLAAVTCDPKKGGVSDKDFLGFISKTIDKVNSGESGIFTPAYRNPSSKVKVVEEHRRTAGAIAQRQDLIDSLDSEIKSFFPDLSEAEVKSLARQAYFLKYIEPDSGLLNYSAFQTDLKEALSQGKKSSIFFFDGDKFSAWKKSYGQLFGNKTIEKVLQERIFKAKEVFEKYGVTFYRHGSRSEEFYILGEVDTATLNQAVAEFEEALNQPFIEEISTEDLNKMPQSGKELINDYMRQNPASVKDGKMIVDLTRIGRGKNGKFSGISLTGMGAKLENNETLKKLIKDTDALKRAEEHKGRGLKATIFYFDRGAPGGTLTYKTGAVVYSATRDGLIGFFSELPFSAIKNLKNGTFSAENILHDMKDSGLGWAQFGLTKGAFQSFLNMSAGSATNAAIIFPTLWQLDRMPSEDRGTVLAAGATGLGGFVGGAKLANLIPGPAWLKGSLGIVGGIGGSKISNEAFAYLYQNSETFKTVVNSKTMGVLGDAGAAMDKPLTGYYGGKLAANLFGYALRGAGAKSVGEKLFTLSRGAGVVTATLSLPGMPLNAIPLGAGKYEQSIQEFANNKPLAGGDARISSLNIYSDEFANIFGNIDANHAPRLALETALLLKEQGYLKKPIQVSDGEWNKLEETLKTGTLEQYLGGFFPGARRDAFISAVREGLIAFQKDLFDRGIKVKAGTFDAETCRLMILAYNSKY